MRQAIVLFHFQLYEEPIAELPFIRQFLFHSNQLANSATATLKPFSLIDEISLGE
jgi:hypothetical protein